MVFKQAIIGRSVAGALLMMQGSATASGFALIEQSGSGLGNAFAGGAASAEDASTIFFNPAGMSRLTDKQAAIAAHAIRPSAEFSNGASAAAALQPLGGNGGDAGDWALVPNAYFAMEVNPRTRIGVGINAPFGLQTEYDSTWMGRFQAIKSKAETINLNPSVSYQVNDSFSIGAGLNYQHIKGELSCAVNYAGAIYAATLATGASPATAAATATAATAGGKAEGISTVSGSDSAWGYNFGALLNVSPQTRVGLAYRSRIEYDLGGTVAFDNRPAALAANSLVADGAVTLPLTVPDSFSISAFHRLNDKWDIMADATWTGWGVFQQLKIDRANGANLTTVQEKWDDTWRISVGANHHYNDKWTARIGVAFDQTPVSDEHRTARIPDEDRTWLALGGQYKPSKEGAVDFGYAHLFVKDASIADKQAAAGKGSLIGNYENSVDIISVQYTHSF